MRLRIANVGLVLALACLGVRSLDIGLWLQACVQPPVDGLARLQQPLNGFAGYNHTEHFYYDGARRVQEVFHSIDAGSGSEQSSEEETSTPTLTTWVDREYIHSAGPGSYVDEFVCEITNLATSQTPYFHLQDANYTVVGLVNAAGAVVRQHTFDAYGQLLYAEDLQAAPTSRIGHQGLFFDRLDAPQGSRDLTPRHTPTATPGVYTLAQIDGHYQNRNRTYAPTLGRWLQADPNGTGSPVLDSMVFQGRAAQPDLGPPATADLFVDGAGRHIAYRGRPIAANDPTGLFFNLPGMLVAGMEAGITEAIEGYTGWAGKRAGSGLGSILENYSINLLFDVEWAGNWDMGDDWGTRIGVDPRSYYGSARALAFNPNAGLILSNTELTLPEWARGTGGRPLHGGLWHDSMIRAHADFWHSKGYTGIEFNRQVGSVRPDLIAYDPGSKTYVVLEVVDTHSPGDLRARREAIASGLGVEVERVRPIKVVTPNSAVHPTVHQSFQAFNPTNQSPRRRRWRVRRDQEGGVA